MPLFTNHSDWTIKKLCTEEYFHEVDDSQFALISAGFSRLTFAKIVVKIRMASFN